MPDIPQISIPMKSWKGGANSLIRPSDIGVDQYAWGENVLNRGGIIQTRPGLKLSSSVVGDRLQGFAVFTPRDSNSRLLIAVDGAIYSGDWPSFNFVKIEGIQFSPVAPLINFCECIQSVKRNEDTTETIIDPIKVMVIADGENPVVIWDGTTVKTMDPTAPKYQTPTGLWMRWTSSALWISVGSQMRVSDLGNPESFYDDQFLATRSFFELPDAITGIVETANERGLLVFTKNTTTVFQSYIRDRNAWQQTPDFQKQVFPNIGCDAGRTATNQYGLTYWHSQSGIVSLDAAINTQHASKLQTIDGQMMRSKRNLSPDMTGACAISFDNLLLVSMPSGGKYNEQTWVLDQAPLDNLEDIGVAWAGVWTGFRPVQWITGFIGGRNRLYCACYDRTPAGNTHIHVWEALREDRKDEGGRIRCQVQLATQSDSRLKVFKYAEIEAVEIYGDVTLDVYVMGTRGPWYKLQTFELRAEEGSIGSVKQQLIATDTILQAYKPQTRTLRTPEFNVQAAACVVESAGRKPNKDKGFALLFEWRGRMGLGDVRMILAQDSLDNDRGQCSISESGEINIVTEDGGTV